MNKASRLAAALTTTALPLLAPAAASAAPINATTDQFPLHCPMGDVTVVSPPNEASFTPGFIVGGHALLIPYAYDFTFTADGQSMESTAAKKAPVPADAMTCTVDVTFVEDGTTITFTGWVVAVLHGKP